MIKDEPQRAQMELRITQMGLRMTQMRTQICADGADSARAFSARHSYSDRGRRRYFGVNRPAALASPKRQTRPRPAVHNNWRALRERLKCARQAEPLRKLQMESAPICVPQWLSPPTRRRQPLHPGN